MWKDHPGAARHPSKEGNLRAAFPIPLLGGVPSADGGVVFCVGAVINRPKILFYSETASKRAIDNRPYKIA